MFISQSGSVRILFVTQCIFSPVSFSVIIPHIFFYQPFDVTISLWLVTQWSLQNPYFLVSAVANWTYKLFSALMSVSRVPSSEIQLRIVRHIPYKWIVSHRFPVFESLRGQQYRFSPVDLLTFQWRAPFLPREQLQREKLGFDDLAITVFCSHLSSWYL